MKTIHKEIRLINPKMVKMMLKEAGESQSRDFMHMSITTLMSWDSLVDEILLRHIGVMYWCIAL